MIHRIPGKRTFFAGSRAEVTDDLLAIVNRFAEEPQTRESVYIRTGIVCNNQVDLYSTRFTDRALDQIAALFTDDPPSWHRQHDKYSINGLPIGRGLLAEVEPMERVKGGKAVRIWWYYPRGDEVGDQAERYFRLQIWRELSLAWWMASFTCDIDGKEVYGAGEDSSDYYPGQKLSDGRVVVGIMDDVTELDEFSLVSRGGQVGTTIEKADASDVSVEGMIAAARARVSARKDVPPPARSWWNGWTPEARREPQKEISA